MINYLSLPSHLASANFAYECLFEPKPIKTTKSDPQIQQIMKIFDENNCPTILDFGAGEGRLISIVNEINREKDVDTNKFIDYYAFDINSYENCKKVIKNIYIDNVDRYIINPLDSSAPHKLLNGIYKDKFDIVLMCNVLHEIEPKEWGNIFEIIRNILKDTGHLLIVEDQYIQHGEKAYSNGFILLNEEQFRILFNIQNYLVISANGNDRLKAHFINKNDLCLTKESLIAAIESHQNYSICKIKEIRKNEKNEIQYIDGLNHGLWTQQFVNCCLVLEELILTKQLHPLMREK